MKKLHQEQLFQLLRQSMGLTEQKDFVATDEDWQWLHEEAVRQSLTGVIYGAVAQLPASQQPPMELLIQWIYEADVINGKNELLNQESARLTRLFSEQGRKTAILKGQANARLYPDKFLREPGDIDIWVEGGSKSVIAMLQEMGLLKELSKVSLDHKPIAMYHHVNLPVTKDHIIVEVHFRPSPGNFNPVTNKRLQRWLEQEIKRTTSVTTDGGAFFVPSICFALVMQLAHIQHHFLEEGLGMRHLCDYFLLLKNATEEDRQAVASVIRSFGLRHTAEALMWVLGEVLHLEEEKMYCKKDPYRGEWMLREMMAGGNFGHSAQRLKTDSDIVYFLRKHKRLLQMVPFAPSEMLFLELNCLKDLLIRIPERIRYRKLSLR